ncbi:MULTISPECIES: hypothetical protein [Streptomyces]|uniref:hypothetical protein n=1 Tax=Streptomyces TaxID=1883 RepID=UPI000AAA42A6|nr:MULTISPECIES: hypothetical protein [Streptomyces]
MASATVVLDRVGVWLSVGCPIGPSFGQRYGDREAHLKYTVSRPEELAEAIRAEVGSGGFSLASRTPWSAGESGGVCTRRCSGVSPSTDVTLYADRVVVVKP